MTAPRALHLIERDRNYIGATAGYLVNIAKSCSKTPSTISAFAADLTSGSMNSVVPAKMRYAATHNAERLSKLATTFRVSIAELLHAADVADDLSERRRVSKPGAAR